MVVGMRNIAIREAHEIALNADVSLGKEAEEEMANT